MKKLYYILALLILTTQLEAQNINFKWLKTLNYETINPHNDNLAAFKQDGKWGFIDIQGNEIIAPKYEDVGYFNNGISRAKLDGKWSTINKKGEPISGFIFTELGDFYEDFALAKKDDNYLYLTTKNKQLKLSNKLEYHNFHDGLARVKDKSKDKWGFINKKGIFVIDTRYNSASDFSGGYALVSNNKEFFYINIKDKEQSMPKDFPLTNAKPLIFNDGMAKVDTGNGIRFINQDLIFSTISFINAQDYKEGFAAVKNKNNTISYINKIGLSALNADFDEVGDFYNGRAWVCKDGKYGYINQKGELIVDPIFSSATNFGDGVAYVGLDQRLGMIKIKEESDLIPNLEFKNITLVDANNNNRIEAEESFSLAVTLHNSGYDTLRDIDVVMARNTNYNWFEFEQLDIHCHSLAAKTDTVIYFKGKAKLDIPSKDMKFEFNGVADNLHSLLQIPFEFSVTGLSDSKPLLAKYWVYKSDHTSLNPGDEANLKIVVVNNGKDLAKSVKIDLLWAKEMSGKATFLEIPILNPGESKEITTTFILDSTVLNNTLTVVANLSEFTNKHKDIKYLSFEMGKMNNEINLQMSTPIHQGQNKVQVQPLMAATPDVTSVPTITSELLNGMKAAGPTNSNKYALVIGNEDYNSLRQSVSYEVNVDFATQDATVFAAYASNYLGIPKQNIILLENATYAQMNFNINKLITMSKARPNEIELYIYYAGHGQHDVDSKETYLIPVDVSIATPTAGIKLEKIYADLGTSNSKRTMVFLDACYSGVGRGIVIKPKSAPVKGNMLVLTASSSSQRSMPYKEKNHGMFTYFLLNNLKKSNGDISLGELYNKVREDVHSNSVWINNVEQTPEMISGASIQDNWKNWTLN